MVSTSMMYLLQIPSPPNSADMGNLFSGAVASAWDHTWEVALEGALYQSICNLGILAAVIFLGFFMLQWVRDFQDETSMRPFTELIWPVLVVFLLSNGGANLKTTTVGLRNFMNYQNNLVLSAVSQQVDLEKTLASLSNYSAAQSKIVSYRQQCNGITDNATLTQCLASAKATAQADLQSYQSNFGQNAAAFFQQLQQFSDSLFQDPLVTGGTVVQNGINTFLSFSGLRQLAEAVMLAAQVAFQQLIEVSLLLTGLMAPLAVGASFLPVGAKPLYAWLTAFCSLGMCKICLNIVTGFVAISLQQIGPTDSMIGPIFFGLMAPILALSMSSWGGMAIFSSILAAASAVASSGLRIGLSL